MRAGKMTVGLAPCLLVILAGCVDLSAVSSFAKQGSDGVAASTTAISNYPQAVSAAARLTPRSGRSILALQAQEATKQTQTAELGLETLSLYFATLAALADDKLVDVKSSASVIGNGLTSLGAVSVEVEEPATSLINLLLTAPLDAWRRSAVVNLIERADPSVQALSTELANFARLTSARYDTDISAAQVYYGTLGGTTNIEPLQEMMQWLRDGRTQEFARARNQAKSAEATLSTVARGHAALKANLGNLSGKELRTIIFRYKDDLTKAMRLL